MKYNVTWLAAILLAAACLGMAARGAEMTSIISASPGTTSGSTSDDGGGEILIGSNSRIQASAVGSALYSVAVGDTLKAEAGARLTLLGTSAYEALLHVNDGSLVNEGGVIDVTGFGRIFNEGTIINNAGPGRGIYFGENSQYSTNTAGIFINNGVISVHGGMDMNSYETLLRTIINNGTLKIENDGACSLFDITMTGGGTGTTEVHFSHYRNNFNAGSNRLLFGGGVGKVDGVQNLKADTVIFSGSSVIEVGLASPGVLSTINITGNVQIENAARIGLTADLKEELRSNADPQALGAFLTATGAWNIGWDEEQTDLYQVATTIGTFTVKKNGSSLYISGFNANFNLVDYWKGINGYDVSGFLRHSNIAPVGTAISRDFISAPLGEGGRNNYDTLTVLVGRADDSTAGMFSAPMLESVLSSFSGLGFTNPVAVAMDVADAGMSNITSRLGGLRAESRLAAESSLSAGGALASPVIGRDPLAANRFWVSGFGSWQNYGTKDGVPGYKYNSGGVMLGYDRWFGPMAVGAAFGYNRGSFNDEAALASDSGIDNYQFALYAAYTHDSGFFASVLGSYMYSDYDMRNYRAGMAGGSPALGWENSDYHADTWMLGTRVGYDFCVAPRLTLTPSVGLFYQNARSGSFSAEFSPDGGGARSYLDVGRVKNHSLSLPVDLAAAYAVVDNGCSRLSLSANVGYAYEFRNRGASGTLGYGGLGGAPRIDFRGRKPGRSTYNVGGGVHYAYRNLDFSAKYEYYSKSKYDAHQVMGTFGINF